MNIYNMLRKNITDAENTLKEYNAERINVVMSLPTDYHNDIESLREFHKTLNYFGNAITTSYIENNNGEETLILHATKLQVMAALDATILSYKGTMPKHIMNDIQLIINAINSSSNKHYRLKVLLKQHLTISK